MKARLQAIRHQYWEVRSVQERRLILAASAVVLPALAYLLLWYPSHQAVGKLRQSLPEQRLQVLYMQHAGKEIEELAHRPEIATLNPVAMKAGIEESAARHQLGGAINSIDIQGAGSVRIVLGAVSFERWLEWLRSLQQEQHIRVESVVVTSLNQPGMVSIQGILVNGPAQ